MLPAQAAAFQLMGVRIKRREGLARTTSQGQYTDDINLDNMTVMMVLNQLDMPFTPEKVWRAIRGK